MTKKICFIMCVNDSLYEEECIRWIKNLHIPDGYEIEQISVWDSVSMTAGYNKAMKASDAKYKVYLHQDVFIIYKDFIGELLKIFEDSKIGMIGLVGSMELPADGVMWHGNRIGSLYSHNNLYIVEDAFGEANKPCQRVEAVDGLLIATQYDIPWREDLFQGWHFYDISQSMEMRRNGYEVVVPWMEHSWVLHDCGYSNVETYSKYQEIFLREYGREMLQNE